MRMIWFLPSARTKFLSFVRLRYGSKVFNYWDTGWNEVLGPKGLRSEVFFVRIKRENITQLEFKPMIFNLLMVILVLVWLFYCCSLYKA
jgi:hypothetical protein